MSTAAHRVDQTVIGYDTSAMWYVFHLGCGGYGRATLALVCPTVPDGGLNHVGAHPTSPIWACLSHTPFGAKTSRHSQLLANFTAKSVGAET